MRLCMTKPPMGWGGPGQEEWMDQRELASVPVTVAVGALGCPTCCWGALPAVVSAALGRPWQRRLRWG